MMLRDMAARSGIKPTTAIYPLRFAAYDYQSLQFATYFPYAILKQFRGNYHDKINHI